MLKAEQVSDIFLAVLLVFMTLLTSCDGANLSPSDGQNTPTTQTPLVAVDEVNHVVTIANSAQPDRSLTISVDTSNQTETFDCGDFHMVSGNGFLQEYTARDFLECSYEDLGNGSHTEHYFFNGQALELEINDLTGATPEQVQQFKDFFPADPAVNSLVDHPDGMVMADLLTKAEPEIMKAYQERNVQRAEKGIPPMQLRPGWANIGCGVAAMCVLTACKILPLHNPVCWVCAASLAVCIIMDMFGLW